MIGVNFDDRSDIKSDPRCELNSTQIFVLSYISSCKRCILHSMIGFEVPEYIRLLN